MLEPTNDVTRILCEGKENELSFRERAGVYVWVCKPTGKVYVGSSKTLYKRVKGNRRSLERGTHSSKHFQNAWEKYGPDAFDVRIVEICELHLRKDREQAWMDVFGHDRLLNDLKTAVVPDEFVCQKIGLGLRNRHVSDETRAKMSLARKLFCDERKRLGLNRNSREHNRKISEFQRRNRVELICVGCGVKFSRGPNRAKQRSNPFHSRECWKQYVIAHGVPWRKKV